MGDHFRPGNDFTYHGERADWWDVVEKGMLFLLPVGVGVIALGGAYLLWQAVSQWL